MNWHPTDHRPDWRDNGAGVYCAECGHQALRFLCEQCDELADEATIGHGSFSQGGTHYPVRPKGQE